MFFDDFRGKWIYLIRLNSLDIKRGDLSNTYEFCYHYAINICQFGKTKEHGLSNFPILRQYLQFVTQLCIRTYYQQKTFSSNSEV